jgi:hypothetical protein
MIAETNRPKDEFPQEYMTALCDTAMRLDHAARAAILFSAATNFRLDQKNPFHPVFLNMLRSYTLSCIRIALDDPQRYANDAVYVAVSIMA